MTARTIAAARGSTRMGAMNCLSSFTSSTGNLFQNETEK
jgi:hypothetical protein